MFRNKLRKSELLLLSHNINPALKGYTFIKYILENDKISINVRLYALYDEIAKEFETTSTAVQECIKYAFKNSDFDKKNNKRNLILLSHEYKINFKEIEVIKQ